MGSNQERYFFLSGLISFSFFILLVCLFGYTLILSPKTEQFAMVHSNVINVSIAISETNAMEQSDPEPTIAPAETDQKQNDSLEAEPVAEISDLFAQVKTEKSSKKLQDDSKRRDDLNELEKELLEKKETPRFSDKVNKVTLAKPSVKVIPQGGSTGPLVNEYHAKIQGLVYTYFRPPPGSAGQVARVRMSISASGKLIGYRIISYSGNSSFNNEVDWLKERLSAIRFPEHPDGKDAVLEFILTAKE